jgi:hypothetical protein
MLLPQLFTFLVAFPPATTAVAQTHTVRVVRDLPYLQGVRYADDKTNWTFRTPPHP